LALHSCLVSRASIAGQRRRCGFFTSYRALIYGHVTWPQAGFLQPCRMFFYRPADLYNG